MATPTLLAQEHRERDEGDRRHDEGDDVVGVEDDGADADLHVEGGVEALAQQREVRAPQLRHQQPARGQQLGEPDRGDREQQAGRSEEAPDDRELDHRAQDERADEAGRERQSVGPSPR